MVDQQNYVSESENSEGSRKDGKQKGNGEDVDKDNFIDENKDEKEADEAFFKKSLKMQKDGRISLYHIISKPVKNRDQDERDHLISYLKF